MIAAIAISGGLLPCLVLALYPLAMSTALVYYAEHYVIDVLAGALLAAVVLIGCQRWENSRDRARAPRSLRI